MARRPSGPHVSRTVAGKAYAGFVRGGNLAPAHAVGKKTFAQFLAARGAG